MNKGYVFLAAAGVISAGLFAGCGNLENAGEPVRHAQKLEVNTRINIDYSIESYAPVQNFSYELMGQNLDETNPVISPVSAYLALAMAGLGAEGDTLAEFQAVLGEDMECLPDALMNSFPKEESGMRVRIANSAWMDEGFAAVDRWLAMVYSLYDAEVYQAQLSAEETRKDINRWVEDRTEGMISDFLSEPFAEDIALVLLDTVYFNGKWASPFLGYQTGQEEFTAEDGQVVLADMMRKYGDEQLYFCSDLAEGLVLPYQGEDYSFVALKPMGDLTVREMYEQLQAEGIAELTASTENRRVNLHLPKFEVTFDRVLNDSLQNMGLRLAFLPGQADFSGLGTAEEAESLHIDLVRQKAVFRLDEEGVEASAATEVAMNGGAAMPQEEPVQLFFDSPFLYLIVENESKVPLFMGILDDPASLQGRK